MNAPLSPLAARLVAARRSAPIASLDEALVPKDHAAAMAVQAEVARELGETVRGWKVGVGGDGVPFAAPLYASALVASPATLMIRDYVLIEMEIAVRLARDLPPGEHSRSAILDALDGVMAGIEVIRGRAGEPPATPFLAFLADNGANLAYVTGAQAPTFRGLDLTSLRCRLAIGGSVAHEAVGGHPQGDPIEPIRRYLAHANDRLGGLRAGHVVTTGSLNKPVRVDAAAPVEVTIEGLGTATLQLMR
ncbi:MAG TPA: fumarylacetoacetate hydrolase family protein [Casimicrobiaceae bacterium]|nr:fumarylacetoacetate hydrolase family protein [Casimicrobiaceae bacterium]